MLRPLHELSRGDRFEFVVPRFEKVELPKGMHTVVSCWGARPPGGKPVDPWMISCRDDKGTVRNFVLPASFNVECEPGGEPPPSGE